jgi:F-type H+-transporting ATPase subunit gamma
MLSFAAENEARMRAMIAARSDVSRKLDELVGSYRRLRQEEITGEIIELCGGTITASDTPRRKPERNSRIRAAGMRDPVSAATAPASRG